MAAGAADGRVLLLDVVHDCVLAQLGQHAGGVHNLAWVRLPCRAGAGCHSECQPSGAGTHEADIEGDQRLLTHAAVVRSEPAPHRTLLASSGADRTVLVYEVRAASGGAADGPPGGRMVSAEHMCSLALPKPPAGLSEAQRGRLWVATAWAPPQCGYQELAGAAETGGDSGAAGGGAGAEHKAHGNMEAGEDAGDGKQSIGDESLSGSREVGGRLHAGAPTSHWLVTSSYGGVSPGCHCVQGSFADACLEPQEP